MVVFCEWYLDRQLEADEQRQRLENDLGVAIDPADRLRHAIEPDGKAVLQLRGPAPVEPGGDRIGEDRRLRGSWLGSKRLEPIAQRLRQEQLVAAFVGHAQKSSCRSSGRPDAEPSTYPTLAGGAACERRSDQRRVGTGGIRPCR